MLIGEVTSTYLNSNAEQRQGCSELVVSMSYIPSMFSTFFTFSLDLYQKMSANDFNRDVTWGFGD